MTPSMEQEQHLLAETNSPRELQFSVSKATPGTAFLQYGREAKNELHDEKGMR